MDIDYGATAHDQVVIRAHKDTGLKAIIAMLKNIKNFPHPGGKTSKKRDTKIMDLCVSVIVRKKVEQYS